MAFKNPRFENNFNRDLKGGTDYNQFMKSLNICISCLITLNDSAFDPNIDYVSLSDLYVNQWTKCLGIRKKAKKDKKLSPYAYLAGEGGTKFTIQQTATQIADKSQLPNQQSQNTNKYEATNRRIKNVQLIKPFGWSWSKAIMETAKFKLFITFLLEGFGVGSDNELTFRSPVWRLNSECLNVTNLNGIDWESVSSYIPIANNPRIGQKADWHEFTKQQTPRSEVLDDDIVSQLLLQELNKLNFDTSTYQLTEWKGCNLQRNGFRNYARIDCIIPFGTQYLFVDCFARFKFTNGHKLELAVCSFADKISEIQGGEDPIAWTVRRGSERRILQMQELKSVMITMPIIMNMFLVHWWNKRPNGCQVPVNPLLQDHADQIGTPYYFENMS